MELEDIARQNPWWKDTNWQENDRHLRQLKNNHYVYERNLVLKEGVSVLYGPRQLGKTTSIKQLIQKLLKNNKPHEILYLDAELITDRFELHSLVRQMIDTYNPKYIFIDEINAVPEWEKGIKTLVDESVLEKKQCLLSGSSSINILRKAERLPGRMAQKQYKFRFYPLSFAECAKLYGYSPKNPEEAIAEIGKLNVVLQHYFIHGGFIRAINTLYATDNLEEDLFSIYSAWIDGELAKIKKSSETATYLLDGIADALTNEVSWSTLSKTVSHPTVADYVETFKQMFIVDYLEKYRRAKACLPRNKKIYFIDPFIYWLTLFRSRKISSASLTNVDSVTMGRLAELSVYAALIKYFDDKKCENDFDIRRYVSFSKERTAEIDFVVNFPSGTKRLECKFGEIGKEQEGVIYLTRNRFEKNKIPLAVFLLFPEESFKLLK